MQIIGGNMFSMFTEGNFLGIIVLGAGFGVGEHTYIYIHPRSNIRMLLHTLSNIASSLYSVGAAIK